VGLGQANLQLPTGIAGQLEVQLTIGEDTSNVGLVSVQ
jgi:uncharacterized protein (TIGR03437 family)